MIQANFPIIAYLQQTKANYLFCLWDIYSSPFQDYIIHFKFIQTHKAITHEKHD